MTPDDDFRALLRDAGAGRPAALERIYRDLAPAVMGYLRGHGAAEPEDLTSEVFVGVVRGLPAFSGDQGDFRSWVFSITHRRLLDERRRLARRREIAVGPDDLALLEGGRPAGDVEEEAVASLGNQRALHELERLTEDQRAVVLLRVVADLSVDQTARVLEKKPGAVKALQRRALMALGRALERGRVS